MVLWSEHGLCSIIHDPLWSCLVPYSVITYRYCVVTFFVTLKWKGENLYPASQFPVPSEPLGGNNQVKHFTAFNICQSSCDGYTLGTSPCIVHSLTAADSTRKWKGAQDESWMRSTHARTPSSCVPEQHACISEQRLQNGIECLHHARVCHDLVGRKKMAENVLNW